MKIKGIILMLLVTLIWGSVPIFSIYSKLPSIVFVFYRVLFATPVLMLYIVKNLGFKILKFKFDMILFLSGISLALNWILLFAALKYADVSVVMLTYYFGPIFAILISPLILKEKLPKWIIVPSVLAISGIYIMAFQSKMKANIIGIILSLSGGMFYGLLAVLSKLLNKKYPSQVIVFYQSFISVLVLLPFVFITNYNFYFSTFLNTLTVGIIHTALALIIWYTALKLIPLSTASILSYLDPVFASLFAWIILNQVPTFKTILGGMFIISAGIYTTLKSISDSKKGK